MNPNAAQLEAITHKDGPALILAGPGSGKTTVITHRVRHLIEQCGVHPEEILVITFTKAAALEMKERFDHLTGKSYGAVNFGTFHACFFTILRYAYNYSADNILREYEGIKMLGQILSEMGSSLSEEPELINAIKQEFMLYKGNYSFLPPDEREEYLPQSCDRKTFFTAFRRYDEALRRYGKVDFEDMLYLTYELLNERADILQFWQNRYRYILIDEFQDINLLQYKIIRLLAEPQNNLFMVGDEDQSIYGFRGSRPELMLRLPSDYPNLRRILLNINYRCSAAILSASNNLIRVNASRYEKETTAFSPEGPSPEFIEFETVEEECTEVVRQVRELLSGGTPPKEIAVLYRTNLQPRRLTEHLQKGEVKYNIHGTLPCLYDNVYLKPMLAYLQIATQKPSRDAVLLVSNKPTRYLTRQAFSEPFVDFEKVKAFYRAEKKDYVCDKIERLEYDLRMLARMNAQAAVHYIRNVIGYDGYLRETLTDPEAVFELLDEMQEDAKPFRNITDFLEYIHNLQEQYKEKEAERKKSGVRDLEQEEQGISLMTFHGAKGLEYRHVFLIDCNETLIPHKKALLPENIEEERRLMYVAMTRAKTGLHLFHVKKRFGRSLTPSRFIGEIKLPAPSIKKGSHILHKTFGEGIVMSFAGDALTIKFKRHPLPKTLSFRHCVQGQLIEVLTPSS